MNKKKLLIKLSLGAVILSSIVYALNRETFFNKNEIYEAAIHEAGHAVLQEEHFPNTVTSIKLEDKPSFEYLKCYYLNKYIKDEDIDKMVEGHTYTEDFDYNTIGMKETKMVVLKAGGFSVSLVGDKATSLKWFQGTKSDETQVNNLVIDILYAEHTMSNRNINDTEISNKVMARESELQSNAIRRCAEEVKENKDKILKLADEIVKSPTKSLTGEQVRVIIS